jgi:hypothetical protein
MDEAAQSRYAHGTGPEPRSYRVPREPVIPPAEPPFSLGRDDETSHIARTAHAAWQELPEAERQARYDEAVNRTAGAWLADLDREAG